MYWLLILYLKKKRLFKQKLVAYIQIKTLETSKAPAKSQPAKAANGKANPGKKAAPQSQGKKTGAQEKKLSLVPPTDTSPSSRPGSGVVRHPPIPGKESLSQDSAQYYRVSHGRSNLVGSHMITLYRIRRDGLLYMYQNFQVYSFFLILLFLFNQFMIFRRNCWLKNLSSFHSEKVHNIKPLTPDVIYFSLKYIPSS